MRPEIDLVKLGKKEMLLNVGCFVTECFEDDGNLISYSKYIKDSFWNNVGITHYSDELVEKYEQYFTNRKRRVSFYLTEMTKPENAAELLEKRGYSKDDTDAIMVLSEPPITSSDSFVITEDPESAENIFLEIFDEVFCKEGEDVYSGTSKDYLLALNDYFNNYPRNTRNNLVIFNGENPIGIAQALFDEKYVLLGSIAVLSQYRRQGATRKLISYVGEKFKDKIVLLSTEKGSINERIYKELGFETVLNGSLYTKKEKE